MLPEKKYNAVNWIDGMKLNKDHFISFERWVNDTYKDGINLGLTDYNYGLLEPAPNKETALDLIANIDESNQLNIKTLICRGITRGGFRIEITPGLVDNLKYPQENLSVDFNIDKAGSEEFAIILSVNTDERMPVGIPNEEEIPYRHPDIMPTYHLHIIPLKQVNSTQFWSNHVIISKFQVIAGEVQFHENYIPPCTRIQANGTLTDYYHQFKSQLEKINKAAMEYIKKNRLNSNQLEQNISYLFDKIVFFSMNYGHSNDDLYLSQPPVYWIDFFIKLAETLKTAQNCLTELEREEVMNYFNQWVSIREIENAQYDLINLKYDHQNILASVTAIEKFLGVLQQIVDKLVFSDKTTPKPKVEQKAPKAKVNIVRINK